MKAIVKILFYSLPVCLVLTLVLQMIVANQMAVYGARLSQAKERGREIQEQNEVLSHYLASLTSIQRVEHEARQLGLKEGTSYVAFDSNNFPVALKR